MANDNNTSSENFCDVKRLKGFNEWRQPQPPKSPLESKFDTATATTTTTATTTAHNKDTTNSKSLCGVKDLSRLSRKRRTFVVNKNGKVCSRKRHEAKESSTQSEPKPRVTKKEPIPMRLRSFPQSFFEQPNSIRSSSLGQNTYSRLPPLYPQENNPNEEAAERPVTPPEEGKEEQPKPPKRVIMTQPNTELLFSLFNTVLPNHLEKKVIKRGRPKRVHSQKFILPNPTHDKDPCMVEDVMGKRFPQLSLENKHKLPNVRLASISIPNGNGCVQLPCMLAVDNNYPQMLRELALVL